MTNYTTDSYEIKRGIINFSKKLTDGLKKSHAEYVTQMIYGISRSNSCIISNITDSLDESINKISTIKRICRVSKEDISSKLDENYFSIVNKQLDEYPVIMVDDTEIIKPTGKVFESLGMVRDGSSKRKEYEKGYYVTEMVALTKNEKQPVSLFSHIHSSHEKNYKSTNHVTYTGLDTIISNLQRKACFVFDRGYDMNDLYRYMHENEQDYIVRITSNRKIFNKGKWYKSTVLRDARKGKIKTMLQFSNESIECYISHLNVELTFKKMRVRLVLVYGIGEKPMMLVTNKLIRSKDDAIAIVRTYMSRWRIEEYFRFKKDNYEFEDIRVRTLKSMNNINKLLSYTITFAGLLTEQMDRNLLTIKVLMRANALKNKVQFYYYQMAKGIRTILQYAHCGINKFLQKARRPKYKQLAFALE